MMFTAIRMWLAKEPAIAWTALSNAVAAGTLWGALPLIGVHLTPDQQTAAVVGVNLVNAVLGIRPRVTSTVKISPLTTP